MTENHDPINDELHELLSRVEGLETQVDDLLIRMDTGLLERLLWRNFEFYLRHPRWRRFVDASNRPGAWLVSRYYSWRLQKECGSEEGGVGQAPAA